MLGLVADHAAGFLVTAAPPARHHRRAFNLKHPARLSGEGMNSAAGRPAR